MLGVELEPELAGAVLATVVGVVLLLEEEWFTERFGRLLEPPRLEPDAIPVPGEGALATV